MRKWFFILVVALVLVEVGFFIFALTDIWPLNVFHLRPEAHYAGFFTANDASHAAVTIVRWCFFLLTAGVVIPIAITIIGELVRWALSRGELSLEVLRSSGSAPPEEQEFISRFDIHQRIQHTILMLSFIFLALTGIPRAFPDWPACHWLLYSVWGGPDTARTIHNIAAFVMLADAIYHFAHIGVNILILKRKFPTAMFPTIKDIKDALQTWLYIFGVAPEPQYERYQYGQKIDYWAIFWGMPVMALTGFVMLFTAFATKYLPSVAVAACVAAHRDEAILAVTFIVIVHVYYGHLAPNTFPINTVMLSGKMLKAQYRRWFALDYDRMAHKSDQVEQDSSHKGNSS